MPNNDSELPQPFESDVTSSRAEEVAPLSVPPGRKLPERIGQFRLRRFIAAGAMGDVYEAAQDKPRRTVAIKVMRQGIASRSALRRFEYESQLLARLHHPGVAEVYEAGAFNDGSGDIPYFAMEYVSNAKRITDYAREKNLNPRERVALFSEACDALEHGHRRGIVHRDLKPANLLVDSNGRIKVIDFGVARATDSDMAVTTLQTEVGQLVGTLQYMSPEQCEGDPSDIDQRSDVYGLGVVLYELLCKRLPYELSGMRISVAIQTIRNFRPPPPGRVDPRLGGDVETIVLKALEKERDRRYRSAGELADDLRRFLGNAPIFAHPPSIVYQMRMFARRNRLMFGAGAITAIALAAGLLVSAVLYHRAVTARSEAEAVTAFISKTLASVDPYAAHGPNVTVRQVLDDAAGKLSAEFAEHPLVKATLHQTIGNAYRTVSEFTESERHLRHSLEIRESVLGPDSPEVAGTVNDLGLTVSARSAEEAVALHRRALAARTAFFGERHQTVAESWHDLGSALYRSGEYREAESCLRKALALRRERAGINDRVTAETLDNLGAVIQALGRGREARQYHEEALAIRRGVFGDGHIAVAYSLNSLGTCEAIIGEKSGAESRFREAREIILKSVGARHPLAIVVTQNLARVLCDRQEWGEAENLYAEALAAHESLFPDQHAERSLILVGLGSSMRELGRTEEAQSVCSKALAIQRELAPPDDAGLESALKALTSTLMAAGRFAAAEPLLREQFVLHERLFGPTHQQTALTLGNLGAALSQIGNLSESEKTLRNAVDLTVASWGEGDWRSGNTRSLLGECLRKMGKFDEAKRELTMSYQILSVAIGGDDPRTRQAGNRLALLYDDLGDEISARKYRQSQ